MIHQTPTIHKQSTLTVDLKDEVDTLKKLQELPPLALLAAVFMLSTSSFLLVELFPALFYRTMDIASYLVFHNISEFFGIMVSLAIFGVGWFTFDQSRNRHALFLSCAFLAIGLMDFMHTLGYAGMPAFLTPNSALKSTQFWIAVRMYSALAFLVSGHVYPESSGRLLSKGVLLGAAVAVSAAVFTGVTYFPSHLPATIVEGSGVTAFKRYSEYLIIILLALSIPAYWKRYAETGKKQFIYYIAAFILCIFSELAFAGYKSVFDTNNVLGHLYKVIAFVLIYQGIFIAAVKLPYLEVEAKSEELRAETVECKKAVDLLKESEERFRMLAENARDLIYRMSLPDGRYEYVSPASKVLFGYAPEEFYGSPLLIQQIIHPDWRNYLEEQWSKLLAGDMPPSYEFQIVDKSGEARWVYQRNTLIRDDGGRPIAIQGIVNDITEQKRVELELARLNEELEKRVRERTALLQRRTDELEQANESLKEIDRVKSMFIASMSHELRTPLNSIIGFSSVLLDGWVGQVNAEQKQNLSTILGAGRHLLDMINDILDVTQIEAGTVTPVIEEFDLYDLLTEAQAQVAATIQGKGLVLREELPHQRMRTDRRRLLQCVLNFLSNAAKFTDTGSIVVEARIVSPSGKAKEKELVEIAVTDTGIGIGEEDLARIFLPFSRIVIPERTIVPGTGLGLFLTRKIATELLKGGLHVSSEYGKGSRFSLRIPVQLS